MPNIGSPPNQPQELTAELISIEPVTQSKNQATAHPTSKVGLGVGLGGGVLVGLQQWLKQRFGFDLLDIEVGLLTWLGAFILAYLTKNRRGE